MSKNQAERLSLDERLAAVILSFQNSLDELERTMDKVKQSI